MIDYISAMADDIAQEIKDNPKPVNTDNDIVSELSAQISSLKEQINSLSSALAEKEKTNDNSADL